MYTYYITLNGLMFAFWTGPSSTGPSPMMVLLLTMTSNNSPPFTNSITSEGR